MRKQQAIWLQEHTDKTTLPTMANVEPTSGVTAFVNWLRDERRPLAGRAVDIGAGEVPQQRVPRRHRL